MTPAPTPEFMAWAEERQKRYSAGRARWARKIGRPYADDQPEPEPGTIPINDTEEG